MFVFMMKFNLNFVILKGERGMFSGWKGGKICWIFKFLIGIH